MFLSICLIYLFTLSDKDFYRVSDGQVMFDTAVSLHEFGEMGISPEMAASGARLGRNGRDYYGKYGLGLSLAEQIPLLFVPLVERLCGQASSNVLFGLMNLLLTALTALLLALCLDQLGCRFRVCTLAAVAFAFSTFAWPYISYDFSEPLQAFCLMLAFWLLLKSFGSPGVFLRRGLLRAGAENSSSSSSSLATIKAHDPKQSAAAGGYQSITAGLAGFVLGFAVLTKANLLLLIPCYAVYLWLRSDASRRLRHLIVFLVPLLLWGAVIAWLNWYRFGSLFDFGYGKEAAQFTNPLFAGLYGLLLGPNKGLIFYAPVALLLPWAVWTMRRRARPEIVFILSVLAIQTLVNAMWWSWEGGWSWGPRMILPIVPFLLVGVGLLLETVTWSIAPFLVTAIVGLAINLMGVLIYFSVWPMVVSANHLLLSLNLPERPATEYVVRDGQRWFYPFVGAYYIPALSPIRGAAWLLRLRYLGTPVSLSQLEQPSATALPKAQFGLVQVDFSLLDVHDRFLMAQLRSAHFWLWDLLTHRPTEEVFSYPAYAVALEQEGDNAVAQKHLFRAFDCYQRAAHWMPNNASPVLKLADLLLQSNDLGEAQAILTRYLEFSNRTASSEDPAIRWPQQRAVLFRLGQIDERIGNVPAALEAYREILALAPPEPDRLLVEKRIAALSPGVSH